MVTDPSLQPYHHQRHPERSSGATAVAALICGVVLALACEPSTPGPPRGPTPRRESSPLPEPTPPKIVSLGVELAALLVELGVGPRVVGADSRSLAIPELVNALDLGDPAAPSPDVARSVQPGLVLVLAAPSEPGAALARALEAEGVAAYLLAPRDANEVIAAIHRVGRLVGRELRAAGVAARVLREVSEIATLRDGGTRLSAVWVLEGDPLVVVGGSGLLHELLELAGAENAFHSPQRDRLSVTSAEVAARAPDVWIASQSEGAEVLGPGRRVITIDPALAELPLLDIASRVRALHDALYGPAGAPAPGGDRFSP